MKSIRIREQLDASREAIMPRWGRRPSVPVSLALLMFVVLCMAIPAATFLFGRGPSRLAFPVALAVAAGACWAGRGEPRARRMRATEVVAVVLLAVMVAGAGFMYSNPDADAYHRPAIMLMSQDWNPVFDATVENVASYAEPTGVFRFAHVAYLPRGAWYFGLTLYDAFGFVEVADSLNVLLWLVSLRLVWAVSTIVGTLHELPRRVFTMVLASAPVVCSGMLGGSSDSAMYSLFLIAACSLTMHLQDGRRLWLVYAFLAMAVLPSLKYTGVVVCMVLAAVFAVAALAKSWQGTRWANLSLVQGVVGAVFAAALVSAVINFSPYLTNWARYGGPFYPIQSFDRRIELKDLITDDFTGMNDDAKRMGYWSRVGYAYLSQSATLALWRTVGGVEGFSPRFDVQGGVGGFGPFFRLGFVASLLLLPFVRVGPLAPMLIAIIATTMAQPLTYVGYARYVPQLYAFPLVVLMAATRRLAESRPLSGAARATWVPWARAVASLCYAMPLLAFPLSFLALQWVISQQNLLAVESLRRSAAASVVTKSYYASHAIKDDCGCVTSALVADGRELGAKVANWPSYSPYFGAYRFYVAQPLDWWPDLEHVTSRNDKQIAKQRDGRNMSFFLREFLPVAVPRLPSYVASVFAFRLEQMWSRWSPQDGGEGESRDAGGARQAAASAVAPR
jgi:hypothetical protein